LILDRSASPEADYTLNWRNPMIIRSGLIKKNDTVDFAEFSRHWKEVHGPLARIVPLMRAYSQNHIKTTLASGEQFGFHRVDGISQLRFETVADMAVGMESPEQHACVVDIRGFLSGVTILIQEEGRLKQFGKAMSNGRKLMYLVRGDGGALDRLEEALSKILTATGGSFRLNRIINRDFRVDSSVPTGDQVIDAVLELFLAGEVTGESFHESASSEKFGGIDIIGAYEVSEHVVLPLQRGA
jgi:uncharacterized protein (TIGR02118 family)